MERSLIWGGPNDAGNDQDGCAADRHIDDGGDGALAQTPGDPASANWTKRIPVKPDAAKVVVPTGYKVGVFAAGLDTPTSATVDKDGNVWVAISGKLLGGPDEIDPPHVKIFDPTGKLLREVGFSQFTTVMNEIAYCAENGKTYIPEYGEKIWEMDGVHAEPKLIIKDMPVGDHRNGGITCKDGFIYFALGLAEQHRLRRPRQSRLGRHSE